MVGHETFRMISVNFAGHTESLIAGPAEQLVFVFFMIFAHAKIEDGLLRKE